MIKQLDKNHATTMVIEWSLTELYALGEVCIGVSDGRLCFVGFGVDSIGVMHEMFCGANFAAMSEAQVLIWCTKIERYWREGEPLEMLMVGTEFRRRVWIELLKIERGQVVSYSDIAQAVDCRGVRAVGSAIGRNPLSLVVPCHRVVRSDGSLGGYLWGLEVKQRILECESAGL